MNTLPGLRLGKRTYKKLRLGKRSIPNLRLGKRAIPKMRLGKRSGMTMATLRYLAPSTRVSPEIQELMQHPLFTRQLMKLLSNQELRQQLMNVDYISPGVNSKRSIPNLRLGKRSLPGLRLGKRSEDMDENENIDDDYRDTLDYKDDSVY